MFNDEGKLLTKASGYVPGFGDDNVKQAGVQWQNMPDGGYVEDDQFPLIGESGDLEFRIDYNAGTDMFSATVGHADAGEADSPDFYTLWEALEWCEGQTGRFSSVDKTASVKTSAAEIGYSGHYVISDDEEGFWVDFLSESGYEDAVWGPFDTYGQAVRKAESHKEDSLGFSGNYTAKRRASKTASTEWSAFTDEFGADGYQAVVNGLELTVGEIDDGFSEGFDWLVSDPNTHDIVDEGEEDSLEEAKAAAEECAADTNPSEW